MEDFIPSVSFEPSRPSHSEEEEEEEEMTRLLDRYAAKKLRGRPNEPKGRTSPYRLGFEDTNNCDPGLSQDGVY